MARRSSSPTVLETPCREWQGTCYPDGYGRIWRVGRDWRVHRWIWTLIHGPISNGVVIMHRCDNPPCFREDHLREGTQAENLADMTEKGRRGTNGFENRERCPQGHEYGTYRWGQRVCLICQAASQRRHRERQRANERR